MSETTESKATARPWTVRDVGPGFEHRWEVRNAAGGCVCDIWRTTEEGLANAELIVRAVNERDSLREALDELLLVYEQDQLSPHARSEDDDFPCATNSCADLCGHNYCREVGCVAAKVRQARAAIAKATEGTMS